MAKAIMIQGTMSNAGKSWLTAGLCRVFAQDGYRVAPFKSQNMALNSFITRDGFEMGRAQVVQAEAAYREPDVRMNPILLKPTSDKGSQVIVNGEVLGNMPAAEYFRYKTRLIPDILNAYDSLAEENDILVIEGAGSPAEINLKAQDIVNMGMAKMAGAPVLLAGDIDRGGVFASLYGTVMLVTEEERTYIKGTIINKFRGDVEILKPGLKMLEDLIRIPTLGVVPYARLDIDDEDSLSERLTDGGAAGRIEIAVIRLPRISNFTDFTPLSYINGAVVRYITRPEQAEGADLLILPGTKNTLGDLKWMRESGMESAVKKHAAAGKPVIGICGGYQMLCRKLSDPHQMEEGGEMTGIGLLDAETVFEIRKQRTRVTGTVQRLEGIFVPLNGVSVEGYEIHMGRTVSSSLEPAISLAREEGDVHGDGLADGNVFGSYVHGIFDSDELLSGLTRILMRMKGLEEEAAVFDLAAHKQREYDRLADLIRSSLDMQQIYNILDKGIQG